MPRLKCSGDASRSTTTAPLSSLAASAGFASWSVDLIYGAVGESIDDWAATLDDVLSLAPPHVSAYALTVEPGLDESWAGELLAELNAFCNDGDDGRHHLAHLAPAHHRRGDGEGHLLTRTDEVRPRDAHPGLGHVG